MVACRVNFKGRSIEKTVCFLCVLLPNFSHSIYCTNYYVGALYVDQMSFSTVSKLKFSENKVC